MKYKATNLEPFGILVEPIDSKLISSLEITLLKEMFCNRQLIVLRGFESFHSADEFSDYCEAWGEVSIWPFGKVLELVEHENPKDHIFDNSYVPMHWDGMYRPQVPEYQIFHCVKAPLPAHGGRTTFTNTRMVLENTDKKIIEKWSQVTGNYSRQMEFYDSKVVSALITKHPFKDYSVIRYNEPSIGKDFINPANMSFDGGYQNLHKELTESLYHPKNFYAHQWETGDIVIADNLTLLHGREKFSSRSPRHIRRVQVLSEVAFDNLGLESYQ